VNDFMSEAAQVLHLPVRLSLEQNQDVDLELINRHTIEPVTMEDIFTFSGNCSNDRQDSYFTRMDPTTTLRNYAEDLKTGVSLLNGHDISLIPYGRSYDGTLVPAADDANSFNAVRGHWYIMRGLTLNGENTDDTIKAMKAGIIRDMSVGFGGDKMSYRCGSCGRDLWDWECPHIPGLEDEHGRMSFSWIVDAHLREVSTVYKGATPGAYIDKAREYMQQGQLSQQNIEILERQFQVRLDNNKRSFFMSKNHKGANSVGLLQQITDAIRENKVEKREIYKLLGEEGETFRQPDDIAIRNELGDNATVDGVKQLKEEAEQGRTYAADMINNAVEARTRAQGDKFDADKYRQMLVRAADLDFVKEEIDTYEAMAKDRFNGGRQTNGDPLLGGEPEDDVIVSERFEGGNK